NAGMKGAERQFDLVTIGRSGVDLYGEQTGGRLEDMLSFAKYIGGSPTNTAIGAARLGLRSGLITRVGADHFGRFIREQLLREDVSTRGVVTDPARLTALGGWRWVRVDSLGGCRVERGGGGRLVLIARRVLGSNRIVQISLRGVV